MKVILINNSSDDKLYATGQIAVLGQSEVDVSKRLWYAILDDTELRKDLICNNIQVSDGVSVLRMDDAVKYIESVNRLNASSRDSDGSTLSRVKVTTSGWHFQISPIYVKTSTWNGYHHKQINPVTLVETDTGFVTYKLYDASRTQILEEERANEATYTVVDWCVNHEIEIVGAVFTQAEPPTTDIYMYTVGAPGILNVPFGCGGLNLKCIGIGGVIDADGKSAKYIHPSSPMSGLNKFRTILTHSAGVVHECQLIYKLFKP
jgi:hypothetical protein